MSRAKLDRRPFPPAPAAPPPSEPFPAFDVCALAVGFCHDPRHAEPCPLPCAACADDCDPAPEAPRPTKRFKVVERAIVYRDYYVEAASREDAIEHVYDDGIDLDEEEQVDAEIVSCEEVGP